MLIRTSLVMSIMAATLQASQSSQIDMPSSPPPLNLLEESGSDNQNQPIDLMQDELPVYDARLFNSSLRLMIPATTAATCDTVCKDYVQAYRAYLRRWQELNTQSLHKEGLCLYLQQELALSADYPALANKIKTVNKANSFIFKLLQRTSKAIAHLTDDVYNDDGLRYIASSHRKGKLFFHHHDFSSVSVLDYAKVTQAIDFCLNMLPPTTRTPDELNHTFQSAILPFFTNEANGTRANAASYALSTQTQAYVRYALYALDRHLEHKLSIADFIRLAKRYKGCAQSCMKHREAYEECLCTYRDFLTKAYPAAESGLMVAYHQEWLEKQKQVLLKRSKTLSTLAQADGEWRQTESCLPAAHAPTSSTQTFSATLVKN
jgi:hypothetical protein